MMKTRYENGHWWINAMCTCCGKSISVPQYCGNRFCQVCGITRAKRVKRRINHMYSRVKLRQNAKYQHLTLTIRSQKNLRAMAELLIASFKRLRNTKYWRKRVQGGAFVIEFKPSKSMPDHWHAHLHILLAGYYLEYDRIMKAWNKAAAVPAGCYIKPLTKQMSVAYLIKYVTKPPKEVLELGKQAEIDCGQALKGLRMYNPFGDWHAANGEWKETKAGCPECGKSDWIIVDWSAYDMPLKYLCNTP